ncbi:DUF4133 domain-containing protein [Hymenobacter tenuis]
MPVYDLNRGINKPVEFKGLVAGNIYLLVAGIGLGFALLVTGYLAGVPLLLITLLTLLAGGALWAGVYALNRRFGEHGLMKAAARRASPRYITNRRSRLFQRLNQDPAGRA